MRFPTMVGIGPLSRIAQLHNCAQRRGPDGSAAAGGCMPQAVHAAYATSDMHAERVWA